MNKILNFHQKIVTLLSKGESLALFAARLVIARVFFFAGLTKLSNFDQTLFLFEYEYALPYVPVELAAYGATAMELAMPILLLLGLFTRYACLPLLVMTIVIQSFVYQLFEHAYWATLLFILITRGPGKLSADYILAKKFLPQK